MTIPDSYIGHIDFLELGIIKEFYSLTNKKDVNKWITEDIIEYYQDDFRVHIVRVTTKTACLIRDECIRKGIEFRNHTSEDRLSQDDERELFKDPLKQHIVLGVKNLLRRANLIPNSWKIRIGATHEYYTKNVDYNVQIQGLPGRTTGYWRDIIMEGHKTGPYRTSIDAVLSYEDNFHNPFGSNSYQTLGFKKKKGNIKLGSISTILSPKNVLNLKDAGFPKKSDKVDKEFDRGYEIWNTQEENFKYASQYGATRITTYTKDQKGFKICTTTSNPKVHTLEEILKLTNTENEGSNMPKPLSELVEVGDSTYRCYVCYENINDINTERYVTIWVKRIRKASS